LTGDAVDEPAPERLEDLHEASDPGQCEKEHRDGKVVVDLGEYV
jgi:hypothetical protein